MYQVIARLKLEKATKAATNTVYTNDGPTNYRINIFAELSASASSVNASAAGTFGFKVFTTDDFGIENEVSVEMVSSTKAVNTFAIGLLRSSPNVALTYQIKLAPGFPTDCFFSIYAIFEQDVEAVTSI